MTRVISGGQTGADRAALDAARLVGIPIGGWCPRGGWAEDEPEPPGVLARYPELRETPSSDPAVRTAWNVRDSDATLVLTLGAGADSPGTRLTLELAREARCPVTIVDVADDGAVAAVTAFLERLRADTTLNVAGPREQECPGLYVAATEVLTRALLAVVDRLG